jgi:CBS domain-containing protein
MSLGSKAGLKLHGTAADTLEAKGGSIVHAIGPRETVYDAVAKMSNCRVGALLVMEGVALIGIVSERDYTRKITLLGRSSKETLVQEIMTSPVLFIAPSTTLGECMEIVTDHRIRHLPVVDNGRVVGVLSIGDLVRTVVAQQAETIEQLSSFIGGDYPV